MKNKSYIIRFILICLLVLTGLTIIYIWQNDDIVTTNIKYSNSKIQKGFDDYIIVQISDLHNKGFGTNQSQLLTEIENAKPNIIVVTGDLIDSNRTDVSIAMEFVNGAVKIAPVYYVSGNHEAWSGIYPDLITQLAQAGVVILDDKTVEIKKGGDKIEMIGVADPSFTPSSYAEDNSTYRLGEKLKTLTGSNTESFKILLSHRPELINLYADNKIDLVFSGHAHGGQFRLPIIGGLFSPGQGFLPKLTSGSYSVEDTTMIVSRGLGNSSIPIRIFNRPEIITVTLQSE